MTLMWFLHHCLSFRATCQPRSWADLAELMGLILAGAVLTVAFFLGLMSLG